MHAILDEYFTVTKTCQHTSKMHNKMVYVSQHKYYTYNS